MQISMECKTFLTEVVVPEDCAVGSEFVQHWQHLLALGECAHWKDKVHFGNRSQNLFDTAVGKQVDDLITFF